MNSKVFGVGELKCYVKFQGSQRSCHGNQI